MYLCPYDTQKLGTKIGRSKSGNWRQDRNGSENLKASQRISSNPTFCIHCIDLYSSPLRNLVTKIGYSKFGNWRRDPNEPEKSQSITKNP